MAGGVYELEPQSALGQRLDVRALNTADKAIVELYQSNSGPNQRWKFIDQGNGALRVAAAARAGPAPGRAGPSFGR
ncbi:MAG: RICIN domain-containing protein [Hymenobacter sp.]